MILFFAARDIKVVRPMYGVELFDGETARFEVEISEDDVHGQWKLNGEVLSPSPVRIFKNLENDICVNYMFTFHVFLFISCNRM